MEKARVWLFFGTLSAFALSAPVLMGTLALRSRVVLGEWPSYNRPDPSTLDFPIHQLLVSLAAVFAVHAPLGLVATVFLWRGLRAARRTVALGLLAFGVVYGGVRMWERGDPGGLLNWFFDQAVERRRLDGLAPPAPRALHSALRLRAFACERRLSESSSLTRDSQITSASRGRTS